MYASITALPIALLLTSLLVRGANIVVPWGAFFARSARMSTFPGTLKPALKPVSLIILSY